MKKILLALVMLLVCFTARSQVFCMEVDYASFSKNGQTMESDIDGLIIYDVGEDKVSVMLGGSKFELYMYGTPTVNVKIGIEYVRKRVYGEEYYITFCYDLDSKRIIGVVLQQYGGMLTYRVKNVYKV